MYHRSSRWARRILPALAVFLPLCFGPVSTVLAATALPPPEAASGARALFRSVGGSAGREAARGTGVVRGRAVTMDNEALRPGLGRVNLNLFEDTRFTGLVDRVQSHGSGAVSYSGRLAEDPRGSFSLVALGNVVAGVVRADEGGLYEIGSVEGGAHYVRQMAPDALPPCGNTPAQVAPTEGLPPAARPAGWGAESFGADETDTVIDLMIVYTGAAMSAVGGKTAIEARAQLAVDLANQAYANSGIHATLRLVHVAPVTYTEGSGTAGFTNALSDLTRTTDGKMDEVHALRDQYGADVVTLFVKNGAYCGVGWVMTSLQYDFSAYGFNVVNYSCAAGDTLAHEIGHNQGCQHDRENAKDTNGNVMAGVFPYSYGWRFRGENGSLYRTVMAYDPGTRIPYFSNPAVLYNNRPTGVAAGLPNASDNTQTINNTRALVAEWRPSAESPALELVESLITAEECAPANGAPDPGELVTLAVSLRNAGGGSPSVTATLEAGGGVEPVTTSRNYGALSGGAPVSRSFQLRAHGECGGLATATLRLTGDGQDMGTIAIPLRLGAYTGVNGPPTEYSSNGQAVPITAGRWVEQWMFIPDAGAVGNVNVSVRLDHPYVGDLTLSLIAPDGTTVILSAANGGSGDNYGAAANNCLGFFTIFDDSAANSITNSAVSKPPFLGTFRPQQPLSTLAGRETQGKWTLRISNLSGAYNGALGCWKLNLSRRTFQCCAPPLTIADALDALRIAGGRAAASTAQMPRLNAQTASPSTNRIDITDAVVIARKAAGLGANPAP